EEESKKQVLRTKAKINESGLKIKGNIIVKESDSIDLSYQLVEILNQEGIQLAVLKKHHKSWLEKFILGSVSSRVIETYNGNILVV
ncbi:MAG: universal stress protein, partial [Cytophagia bacterium]